MVFWLGKARSMNPHEGQYDIMVVEDVHLSAQYIQYPISQHYDSVGL